MPSRRSAFALSWLAAVVACGGRATDGAPSGDGSGGASSGVGGALASGGAPSSTGGSSTGGASTGTGGLPALCGLPLDGGDCDGYAEVYGYDVAQGACVPFVYGLCGGNENRFDTLEACESACFDARIAELTKCATSADCELRNGLGCCEACDGAHWVGVNKNADFSALCEGVGCDACVPNDPAGLVAVCRDGVCSVGLLAK